MGINQTTLEKWIAKYPAFSESFEAGGLEAAANVAKALYHRAIGYSHPEQKIFMNKIKEFDEQGRITREYQEPLCT